MALLNSGKYSCVERLKQKHVFKQFFLFFNVLTFFSLSDFLERFLSETGSNKVCITLVFNTHVGNSSIHMLTDF